MKILVTGATGYIGGRLIPLLLEEGHKLTVLVRDKERIQGRAWADHVTVIEGDLLDKKGDWMLSLGKFSAAYYLVHSMYSGDGDFSKLDVKAARNFCKAASDIKHIIYLGGLLPNGKNVSKHLKSRAETGKVLRKHLPVTEFRAGPIIGSGSASFEMVRYLTERLPIMVTPKWIFNKVQPIAIRNVLEYLVAALKKKPNGVIEIGSEAVTFKEMMQTYACVRKLPKRIIIPLPVLTPKLAARWVGLVTPIPNRLAIPLVEGVNHPVLADTQKANELFPKIKPFTYKKAVELALNKIITESVETRWSGSVRDNRVYKFQDKEGMMKEVRHVIVNAMPEKVFNVYCDLGGDKGWLAWNWAWKLRGFIDKIFGGPGLRRGRRRNKTLLVGDTLDFWRIEKIVKDEELLLRAEMKVPGDAWLRLESSPLKNGKTLLTQTAYFIPKGLPGLLYWYAMFPAHLFIFSNMVNEIKKIAEAPPPDLLSGK